MAYSRSPGSNSGSFSTPESYKSDGMDYESMKQMDDSDEHHALVGVQRQKMEELRDIAQEQQDLLNTLRARLETAEAELEGTESKLHSAETHLEELEHPHGAAEAKLHRPPGPKSLRFVDGDLFTLIGLTVIVVNVITMFMEMAHPHYTKDFFWLDQAFLVFYVVELTLKAILHQKNLLFGPAGVVCWNWMDLVIVVTGVLDMWLMPLIQGGRDGPSLMGYIRMLRLARLVRVLKIVRIFLTSDLHWTEGTKFQGFIMGVICFNALLIGAEADFPHYWAWFYIENLLLVIFSFELLVRLRYQGKGFFCHPDDIFWNWLDMIIVAVGVLDTWFLPGIELMQKLLGITNGLQKGNLGQILMIIRMARLLRILRLVRLIRGVPQLKTLVIGIAKSMYGMGWVLLLTVTVLYVCALLFVKLVGKQLIGEFNEEICALFENVQDTMFNLFIVMNADLSNMTPFLNHGPECKLVMFLFTVMSNWAIFSILTAVVSDHMANVSAETSEERALHEAQEKEHMSHVILNKIFDQMDTDHSGTIKRSEFDALLEDEITSQELKEATNMHQADLVDLFRILSKEKDVGEPRIYRDDFLEGLKQENTTVSMRSVMRLEKRMADMEDLLNQALKR